MNWKWLIGGALLLLAACQATTRPEVEHHEEAARLLLPSVDSQMLERDSVLKEVLYHSLEGVRSYGSLDSVRGFAWQDTLSMAWAVGHWLDPDQTYLRVHLGHWGKDYFWLYWLQDSSWQVLAYTEMEEKVGAKDSVLDLNSDGYGDYLFYRHNAFGCCMAHHYNISLYDPSGDSLVWLGDVINPTFYPKEQCIRHFTYGHAGEGDFEFYTYQLDDFQLDTVEHIAPYVDKALYPEATGTSLLYTRWVDGEKKAPMLIDHVPQAYHVLNDAAYWRGDDK